MNVVTSVLYNTFTAAKIDGYKDGDQMKLSKQKLKQIIYESLKEVEQQEDPTKIKTKAMSTGARLKDTRDRITGDEEGELTNNEKGIIHQLEDYITTLAAPPGIDLMLHKPLLQRVLKLLKQQTQNSVQNKQGDE